MATTTTPSASLGASGESTDGIAILLQASEAAAANSLDLDALLVELSKLVKKIVDYELYALLLPTRRPGTCASPIPSGFLTRWRSRCASRSAPA